MPLFHRSMTAKRARKSASQWWLGRSHDATPQDSRGAAAAERSRGETMVFLMSRYIASASRTP